MMGGQDGPRGRSDGRHGGPVGGGMMGPPGVGILGAGGMGGGGGGGSSHALAALASLASSQIRFVVIALLCVRE